MAVITGIFILYFLFLVFLLAGWRKAMRAMAETVPGKEPLISVVIPVRNEEMAIADLLGDLQAQEYKNLEIIVVNDDSSDETFWVASRFPGRGIRVIHSNGTGKKAAIASGVSVARGSIIVTTDADCRVPPQWLRTLRAYFRAREVMMVVGGVRMAGDDSFFSAMQVIEFSSLVGSGAATAAAGIPTMCNGANLAFRKKAFKAVNGYSDNLGIPSGDDEFLMRKIEVRYPGSVVFAADAGAVVTTKAQPDVETFYHQRLRWASKWRYNTSVATKAIAVTVVVFQLTFILNWFFVFTPMIQHALFLMAIKMILEAAFLLQVCRFLGVSWNWLAFFGLQFAYPCYVVAVSGASFFRPYRWKDRIFKPF